MLATTTSHAPAPFFQTTASSPRVHCAFVMPGCSHTAVFHNEYVRTNRTNHTKIMRCFPHCCPGHRTRSYCGSPLHVKLQSQSPSSHHDGASQLVVFSRFRPAHIAPLNIGDRVSLQSILASLQSTNPSTGEWIESRLSPFHNEPLLFEINPSGRWYYPWSGAATIAMRAIEHVFEAVVFCYVNDSELEVVAQTASPNFGLKSFRRSAAANVKKDDVASPKAAGLKRKAVTRAASPTDSVASATTPPVVHSRHPQRRLPGMTHSSLSPLRSQFPLESASTDAGRTANRRRTHDQAFPTTSFPALNSFISAPPLATQRTPPPHSSANRTLAMLENWLHELPASSAGSRSMLAWQEMVQAACEAQVSASDEPTSARGGFVPLLSVLDREMTTQSTTRSSTSFSAPMTSHAGAAGCPLDTIDAAVRVLLHEWLAVDSTRASSAWMARLVGTGLAPHREELAAAHDEWLSGATARAQQYVHANTRASWSQLMATTARLVEQSQQMNELDATSEFGFRSFVAKYRERLQVDGRQHKLHTRKHQRLSANNATMATLAATPRGLSNYAPVWTSRMEDVSIEMDAMSQHSLSLLTVVQFWKHLCCLRLDFSPSTTGPAGPPAQLSVASVFNSLVSDGCFTKLTLDGQYRWFNCLPSGEPTVGTTLMGYVVGDYVGRATSAGTIHITTYMWPATNSGETTATAFAWHWTLDGASLSLSLSTDGVSSTVVSVVVESAWVRGSPHAMETMSTAEKLRSVDRWQHACEMRLAYNAL